MAKAKKRGLIDKFFMGAEKSEGYARSSLPTSRWELFWDIFKGRFTKIMLLNILLIVFCLPVVALFLFRTVIISGYGAMYPFAQGLGSGYGAMISLVGLSEDVVLNVNLIVYALSPVVFLIASIGVAGAAYIARNLVWTEGIFVTNDFWRGIRQNLKQMLLIALVYSFIFYFFTASISLCDKAIVMGEGISWLFTISKIVLYLFFICYSIMTLHMITMSVTYELKFIQLMKNAFLFTIAFIPQNLFFLAVAIIPFILLLLGGIFEAIGIIMILLFGGSYLLLVWTNYSHWIYDKHINDHVKGAKKKRGIYDKIESTNSKALQKYKQQIDSTIIRSSLKEKPIKPITDDELRIAELPTSFSRKDLLKLNESKEAIYEDHRRYVEEHKNDPEFQPTEQELAQRKLEEERQKRIEKAKKALSKRK